MAIQRQEIAVDVFLEPSVGSPIIAIRLGLALLLVSLAALKQDAAIGWLPGVWSMLVGLGLYSCNKLLPAASQIAAGWMIVAGGASMSLTMMHPAQPHLVIAATLGIGQAILAVTLLKGGNRHG